MLKLFFPGLLCMLLTASCTETKPTMSSAAYPQIPVTYPTTDKDSTEDEYHGQIVRDDYRWLEDDNSVKTKDWVTRQNEVTFGYLEQIPFRQDIEERLTELVNYPRLSSPYKVGEYYFYGRNDGLQNQSVIYYKKGLDGEERVFIDPNALNAEGTTSINLLGADKQNRYMAYSRSDAGSDWQTIYIRDIATNEDLEDELQWVKFSGAGWYGDGFFYSRYPAPAEGEERKGNNLMHSVYYHSLGQPQSRDRVVFEDADHPDYYHYGGTTEEEDYLIMYAAPGTDGFATYYLPLGGGELPPVIEPVALFADTKNKSQVVHTDGTDFWVLTDIGAPNYRLVKININKPQRTSWVEIIPESEDLLQSVTTGGGYLFANYLEKATDRFYRLSYDGEHKTAVQLPGVGSAGGFSGKEEDKQLFYVYTSFTYPPTIFEYDVETNESKPFFEPELKFDPKEYEEKQVSYISKDGTEVTMFLVHKKGLELDGDNPTYLYGYGGFNISLSPSFSVMRMPLLENGGVFAMANLRGGGEYGESWHQAGMLENKQNVFDDFISAAEYLIEQGYTRKEKLAIAGGSNGGLLVGAAMTQRPDLFAVAFPAVGVMDMLRYHKFTVGKGWIPEYGSSEDSSMFPVLHAYSPLHNLRPGTAYPATMITTADHDDRVVPAHSFKYAARLQETQAGERPVLIRIETNAGHGAGKPISKMIEEEADRWSFFFYNTQAPVKYAVKG
ncbi:prolyl oligopeptidase family protein [Lewinella sp. JB7]|uniref:prolyl oligopeptidase family serine peptidase n=1 Tax=Lewinella sp. JB7 TaxID=2962887 RepID=UPI0020CA2047|nr:prolyl oligopeptidase family serine peptidase [Lewinella sp. JB7]MCP9235390.1 prolyl oligopeptidase family serine peptidase [Lewinella sp. JB7]